MKVIPQQAVGVGIKVAEKVLSVKLEKVAKISLLEKDILPVDAATVKVVCLIKLEWRGFSGQDFPRDPRGFAIPWGIMVSINNYTAINI